MCDVPFLAIQKHVHPPTGHSSKDFISSVCEAELVSRSKPMHLVEPNTGEEIGERGVCSEQKS